MRVPAEERFWPKVNKTDSCWLWTGTTGSTGYGNFYAGKVDGAYKWVGAHRFSYELVNGTTDLEIDHLCRVRACVRPDHLEAVTTKENLFRRPNSEATRTKCPYGHAYTEANTYINPNGSRKCRECGAEYKRKRRGVTNVKVYNTKRRMSQA